MIRGKRKYWSILAQSFRDELVYVFGETLVNKLSESIEKAPNIKKALHLGCGAGHFTILWADKAETITGVDEDSTTIWIAQNALPEELSDQICFERISGDNNYPFNDEEFDTIIVDTLMNNVTSSDGSMKEYKRMLKPGGKIIFIAYSTLSSKIFPRLSTSFKMLRTYGMTRHYLQRVRERKLHNLLEQQGFLVARRIFLGTKTRLLWLEAVKVD